MQMIAQQFQDQTFTYTQLDRQGMIAVYEQRHKVSHTCRYEVVRLHIQAEHTWPNGTTTPEKEAYPPSSAWGREGWTFYKLADAQDYAKHLEEA